MSNTNIISAELPTGWLEILLKDFCDYIMGQSPPSSTYNADGRGLPFYQGKSEFGDIYPKPVQYCSKPKKIALEGDILISVRAPVGPTNICPHKACIGRGLSAIRPLSGIPTKFILYLFRCYEQEIAKSGTGTTFQAITKDKLINLKFNLPPLPEQHRIVAKIEELFSDLDNAIESLKKAREQLKTYRQAVLKWAFEGRLTEQWRKENNPEPAEKLLEKIKLERERLYQEQLEDWKKEGKKWEEGGKTGKKPSQPNSLKQSNTFTEEERPNLYYLPDSWVWVRVNDVSLGVEYGTSAKSKTSGKVPVLRMGNIQNTRFDWSDLVFTDDDAEIDKYKLNKDDVLFNRTNSPELVGKTAIYLGERPAIYAGYLIRLNQIPTLTYAKYLNYYLNSLPAKIYGKSVKTDGVNQSNINGRKLLNYPYPICDFQEQNRVVDEIETRLSVCDNIESNLEETFDKAEALRQSILKRAFEGKLVPQNPNDEPAWKLLERIRAERESTQANGKTSKAKQLGLNI